VSSLEAIWALEASTALTDDERADAIANLKAAEWSNVSLPVTAGSITVTGVEVRGPVVEFTGEGGTVDWPLRLINAPIGVPDPAGTDVDASGQAWRVDVNAILVDILGRFQ
jgi:hypothetical protein